MDRLLAYGFGNAEMKIRPYTVDGDTLNPLPGVRPYAHPDARYGARDPGVNRVAGRYVMAATRPLINNYLGVSTHVQIAVSDTLVAWRWLHDLPSGVPDTTRCWAPEWLVDGDRLYLYYSVSRDSMATFDIYCRQINPQTLIPVGEPVRMEGFSNHTAKVIDAHVTRMANGRLVMFVKDEVRSQIMRAWADDPMGPWELDRTGNWLNIPDLVEGPELVPTPTGWRLYYDRHVAGPSGQLCYRESGDLDIWSDERMLSYSPPDLRHLALMWLSAGEWTAFRSHPRRSTAWNSTAQPLAPGATRLVAFADAVDDPDIFRAPYRLVAPESGTYTVYAELVWEPNDRGQRSLAYRVNGGPWRYMDSKNANGGGFGTELNFAAGGVSLNAGDFVEIGALHNVANVNVRALSAAATLERARSAI